MRDYGMTLVVALLLGILGFFISKSVFHHRHRVAVEKGLAAAPQDTRTQLAWMRSALDLSDEEFERECAIHDAHRAEHRRLHGEMKTARQRLKTVLETRPDQTTEALAVIRDYELRLADCEHAAILHVQKVAAAMNPASRKKYLHLMLPHLFHDPEPPSLLPAAAPSFPPP